MNEGGMSQTLCMPLLDLIGLTNVKTGYVEPFTSFAYNLTIRFEWAGRKLKNSFHHDFAYVMKCVSCSIFRVDSRLSWVSTISRSIGRFRMKPGISCSFNWTCPITMLRSALMPFNSTFKSLVDAELKTWRHSTVVELKI